MRAMGWMGVWALAVMAAVVAMVDAQGYWETAVANAGISTMHSAVTHYGNVVLLDRTNIGPSQLALGAGVCRDNPADRVRHEWKKTGILMPRSNQS